MDVIILCGGQGTRLREETEFKPKPMVMVGGRPILWHIMKAFGAAGLRHFILCLGYKGEMIKEYFLNYQAMSNDCTIELGRSRKLEVHSDHAEEGFRVTLADTGASAMTGSRVKQVEKYVTSDTVCIAYGDGLWDTDITQGDRVPSCPWENRYGRLGATAVAVRRARSR